MPCALTVHVEGQVRLIGGSKRTHPSGSGGSRSFSLAADGLTRMRAAIAADQAENRWPSDSGWWREAISAAADLAERKSGDKSPPAPARLRNRLTR